MQYPGATDIAAAARRGYARSNHSPHPEHVMTSTTRSAPSLDEAEIAKFSAMAAEWWEPKGKFAVLHAFNPVRLEFIRLHATAAFDRDPAARSPLSGLRILDIGCGGGLISEPLAKMGAKVTAIDPSQKNIKTASVHAGEQGLDIDYRVATAEELAEKGESFDIVLNMEVLEHVADPAAFITTCAALARPRGLMFCATLNRTMKSFALAIVGAEYILGWLPRGTHHWEKFITPDELKGWLKSAGMDILEETGVAYSPLTGKWVKAPRDMDVNYMLVAQRG